jgi:hypothetical protein
VLSWCPNCLFFSLLSSLVKPLRHYAVFLSEDSSDEECRREEAPSTGFTESLLFSAPFEWSLFLFPAPWAQPGDSLGAVGSMGDWGCLLPWGETFLGANFQGGCHVYRPSLRLVLCRPHRAVTAKVSGETEALIPIPYKGRRLHQWNWRPQ